MLQKFLYEDTCYSVRRWSLVSYLTDQSWLKAIACSGHGKMKMIRFIIEHLGLLRVVVVIYGTLKTGDLKNDIPDLAHTSWGGFL